MMESLYKNVLCSSSSIIISTAGSQNGINRRHLVKVKVSEMTNGKILETHRVTKTRSISSTHTHTHLYI